MGDFPSLEKSTKLSVSWYGVPVLISRYLGKKMRIGDATVRRKKNDATVNITSTLSSICSVRLLIPLKM